MDARARKIWSSALVAALACVTAALLLPGYLTRAAAVPPTEGSYFVRRAFDIHTRVYDAAGTFGRLSSTAQYGAVTSFDCAPSAVARREFGWRGAREVIFDCPATFTDSEGRSYAWVFRVLPADDTDENVSPDGYRTMGIDAAEAHGILAARGLLP
ncbi:hypothetical protein ACRARG_20305 [Pseudooceanicola sp. C21-150M6]|uniref:hypothetical protein n=1 Tax=Pseudooceanicola sp. C21-150M6 TaxID=3434355 RepID=UPI003D7F5D4A